MANNKGQNSSLQRVEVGADEGFLDNKYQGAASLTVTAKSLRRRHFIFDDN